MLVEEETCYIETEEFEYDDLMSEYDEIASELGDEEPQHQDDIVGRFMRDISKYRILTKKVELELFKQYHSKRTTEVEKQRIRNTIISSNTSFVINLAQQVAIKMNDFDLAEDLIGAGNIALVEAFNTFNYKKGYKFFTWASYYVRRAINTYLYVDNIFVRPKNYLAVAPKIKKIEQYYAKTYERKPTPDELVAALQDIYDLELKYRDDVLGTTRVSITDTFVGTIGNVSDRTDTFKGNGKQFYEPVADNSYEDTIENEDLSFKVREALGRLSKREETILMMSNGIGEYYREYKDYEIAEVIGISTERVRQLKMGALEKMRRQFKEVNA